MLYLKQSTAVTIKMGPFLDDTDGKTAEGSLTLTQADFRVSKNGGNFAQKNESSSATHDELGFYDVAIDATDTNTLGRLLIAVHETGALPVWKEFMVVPANVWDSIVGGTDYLQTDAVQVEGSDATDQINAACDTAFTDYDPPTKAELDAGFAALNDLSAAEVNAEVDTALADYDAVVPADLPTNFGDLAITATTGLVSVGTNNDKTGYSISGTKTTLDALNDVSTAEVNAEVDTALADYDPPTKAELDSGLAGLNDPTAAAIADAVWDEAIAGHVGAGSFGEEVQAHALSSEISALNDLSAAEVNAEVDTALADYDPPTKAELDAGFAALNDFDPANDEVDLGSIKGSALTETSAGYLAAALSYFFDVAVPAKTINDVGVAGAGLTAEDVWTYATRILTAGTNLNDLSAAEVNAEVDTALADYDPPTKAELDSGLAGLNDPTAAAIADAVWDEAKAGHVAAGSFGEEVQAHALSSEISALNDLSAAEVNAEVDTALADYDPPTKAELDSGLAALNDLSAAEVNAQVDAALVTVQTESYAADGAAATIPQLLYMIWSLLAEANASSTTITAKKLDGSTTSMTFTLDDADTPTSITRAT